MAHDEEHIDEHGECAARIHELEAALRPFAEMGALLAGNNHDAAPISQCFFHAPDVFINAGHLKAARAALK